MGLDSLDTFDRRSGVEFTGPFSSLFLDDGVGAHTKLYPPFKSSSVNFLPS